MLPRDQCALGICQSRHLVESADIIWWNQGVIRKRSCVTKIKIEDLREISSDDGDGCEYITFNISGNYHFADDSQISRIISKDCSGLYNVNFEIGGEKYYIDAVDIIANNENIIKKTSKLLAAVLADLGKNSIGLSFSDTLILSYDIKRKNFLSLYRGSSLGAATSFSRASALSMSVLLAEWLKNNIHPSGKLIYNSHPSNAEYVDGKNNTIRQWMTTLALIEYAKRTGDADLLKVADCNTAYNLGRFFKEINDFGVISYGGSAKLGASSFAALAIVEREGLEGPHREIVTALLRGIDGLWNSDGSFRTFFYPSHWNGNQNFYPGETLYLWSILILKFRSEYLIEKFLKSTLYYKNYFRENANPAFVPWHTMAQYYYYKATGDKSEFDFIFEMNDFIVDLQETSSSTPKDVFGRFFDPQQASFGPPHASSTAVYLESLVYARCVAEDYGSADRVLKYSRAIDAAFGNLSCLQFKERNELFYISDPKVAWGGIRTNPYDNTIRVDNVQHALAACNALYKVTELDTQHVEIAVS